MNLHILHTIFFTPMGKGRWGLPVVFKGQPGVAKTSILALFCAQWGVPFEGLAVGARGEGAFGVVPVPMQNADGKTYLDYPAPCWSHKFDAAQRGLVLTDEMSTASEILQHAMMALLTDRTIGSHQLPAGVRIIGAMNPPEVVRGYTFAAPVANRLGHMDWGCPTVDEHVDYMDEAVDDAPVQVRSIDEEEARVMAAWRPAFAKACALEAEFLKKTPGMKNACPKPDDPKSSGPWPSDRTWEYATRALASAWVHGLSAADTETLVASFIGEAAATAWFTFIEQQDLPDPAALLDGKETFKHDAVRLDRTYMVLRACTKTVCDPKCENRAARAEVVWDLLLSVGQMFLETVTPFATVLAKAGLNSGKTASQVMRLINPAVTSSVTSKKA